MVSIGEYVVYVEGRNGNSQTKYKQNETLNRAFEILEKKESRLNVLELIQLLISKVVDLACEKSEQFYIRAMRSEDMGQQVSKIEDEVWEKEYLGVQEMDCINNDFGWANYPVLSWEKTPHLCSLLPFMQIYTGLYFLSFPRNRNG